jgi:helicase MOV-10
VEVPNACFYEGKLIAVRPSRGEQLPLKWTVVEGADRQEKGGTSRYNEEEIAEILREVDKKLRQRVPAKDMGIISPYACQNDRLKAALYEKGIEDVEVGSVDMWQGREKPIMLYSAVRHDPIDRKYQREGCLGHAADPRRFCVAITRARDELHCFGSPFTMATDRNWARVLRRCIESDTVYNIRPATHADLNQRIRSAWDF